MYRREDRAFRKWASERGEPLFPTTPRAIGTYLEELFNRGMAINTLDRIRAALAVAHDVRASVIVETGGIAPPNAVRDGFVANVMARLRKEDDRGTRKKKPLRYEQLVKLCNAQPATLTGQRNRTMAAVAWWGMLRGDEVCNIHVEDLEWEEAGIDLRIRDAKTDRSGEGQFKALPQREDLEIDAVRELKKWFEMSGITSGAIFRRIWPRKDGTERLGTHRLSFAGWDDAFASMVRTAKLPARESYGTHSFRRGAATELSKGGASTVELMKEGRWKSATIAARYVGEARLEESAMRWVLSDRDRRGRRRNERG